MSDDGLVRGLGPWQAAAIVVGTIVGTGVFMKTTLMTQLGGSAAWVLAAWAVAGVLSLAGAMTYAELGGMFPAAGGEYVYLREGYGPGMAFLYGWNRFWIATPGSIAAYAVGSATFLGPVLPFSAPTAVALALIAAFTALNLVNVRAGGNLNAVLTAIKVAVIAVVAVGALVAPHGSWSRVTEAGAFPGWGAFGAMVLAALWAYDGWNNLPMAAGEVRDPHRNVPRAILFGTLAVLAIYALVNLGYFHALPIGEIVTSASDAHPHAPAVAAKAASSFLGDTTATLFAIAITFCALSAMNGSILTGARVPYAVAKDGLAPRALAQLSVTARVPATAVVVQGALACVFALSGSFDQLTEAVVFASWFFYALNGGTVLLLRRRAPDRARPFRVPGYPLVPIVFVLLAALLLVNTIVTSLKLSILGIGTTALGALVYLAIKRRAARAAR
jgi:APA family basic amino acid/polyamine antiporter